MSFQVLRCLIVSVFACYWFVWCLVCRLLVLCCLEFILVGVFWHWFACSGCGFLGWLFWVLLFGLLFKAGVVWLFLGLMVVLVCCLCLLITLRFGGCWFCFALSCGPDCVGLCLRCCLLVCAV